MADGTGIQWAEATWNPITGCSVLSPGCKFCYAMKDAGTRLRNHPSRAGLTVPSKNGPVWNGEVRFNSQWLDQFVVMRRPRVIFVCAHSDLFYEKVPFDWIDQIYARMAASPWHIYIVLTKRPERAAEYWQDERARAESIFEHRRDSPALERLGWSWAAEGMPWPLPNIWHGTSAEDQPNADKRVPEILKVPSALHWVSIEPMLGPVDLSPWTLRRVRIDQVPGYMLNDGAVDVFSPSGNIGWVVAGGDSIGEDRFCDPAWLRVLRDQCVSAKVPFFLKQYGRYFPAELIRTGPDGEVWRTSPDGTEKWSIEEHSLGLAAGAVPVQYDDVGKAKAGRLLDGREWSEMPKQLGWAMNKGAAA